MLNDNNLIYEEQKIFEWLKLKLPLRLDFYLPDYSIAIECQGIQHFKCINYFGGEKGFKETIERDKKKKELCDKHNIKILYYTNLKENFNYFSKYFNNKNELIKKIKTYEKECNWN